MKKLFTLFCFLIASCSQHNAKVTIVDVENNPIPGVLGLSLGKFSGENVTNMRGAIEMPPKGVFVLTKKGYRPLIINHVDEPFRRKYKMIRVNNKKEEKDSLKRANEEYNNLLLRRYPSLQIQIDNTQP